MRYIITTFGCQANEADSERIAQKLERSGYKKAPNEKVADLIVINACSVRQSAIDRLYARINKYKNKKIILAGCLLEADRKKLTKNKNIAAVWHPDDYFDETPLYSDKTTALVPIMTGCDNFCTYCAVPFTRGREKSRTVQGIIKEVKQLIRRGRKEIWLLGQNVNSYNSKHKSQNFPWLLRRLNDIPGNFQIRFTSPHPKDFSDTLIKTIAKCNKVTNYINLPVQSGDNEILKRMNRGYTREQYIRLVKKIRKAIPGIKISTDVIVGFPGETRKQFQNTVALFKEIQFDKAYVNRYSPRPGTAAAITMKDNVSPKEKKRRWSILDKMANSKIPIIVILGPTASGKSSLAIEIARKFSGEVISADSRQLYKGMNIGSGKITKKEMRGVKHHLLDIASPRKLFSAVEFKEKAEKAIQQITKKGKIPITCGGTGFYIHALLDGQAIPAIAPDRTLRKKLETETAETLFQILKGLNPERAKNIDAKNKRRLIRAIEIATHATSDVAFEQRGGVNANVFANVLWLGIKKDPQELKKRINKRVDKMIKAGLEKEVKNLVKKYGWTKVLDNTIGYSEWRAAAKSEVVAKKIKLHTRQYAKRQMTWFKKYHPKTHWVKNKKEAFILVKKFLNSN
jgi:tRNA-2-methylthio-N6-dimethylallyladenosine synthase